MLQKLTDAPWRNYLLVLIALVFVQSLAALWMAYSVRDVLVTSEMAAQISAVPALSILTALSLLAISRYLERLIAERFAQRYAGVVRIEMLRHLILVMPERLKRFGRGGVLLRFLGDLSAIRNWLTQGIPRLSAALFYLVVGLTALLLLSWKMAAGSCVILTVMILLYVYLGRAIRSSSERARRRRAHLVSNVIEKIAEVSVIQVHAESSREIRRLKKQNKRLRTAMETRARKIGLIRAASEVMLGVLILWLVVAGSWEISTGLLSTADLVAVLGFMLFATAPLRSLARVFEYGYSAKLSFEKLQRLLELPAQKEGRRTPRVPHNQAGFALRFDKVTVAGRFGPVTVEVQPGQKIALLGDNGAGKSSFLKLCMRLVEPSTGKVRINNRSIDSYRLGRLRRRISYISDELPMLRGSIRRNLTYGISDPDPDLEAALCRRFGVTALLDSLVRGDQTRISEHGTELSSGERQRLQLVRALLKQPQLLLLDEPETASDPSLRHQLGMLIKEFDKTLIFATHDRQLAACADQVWEFEQGQLVRVLNPESIPRTTSPILKEAGL